MAPRRTLAEELADLATPRPAAETDFEADELAEAPALEDEAFDLDQQQQPTRKAQEKKNRLRADIDLQGPAYSGKRTSRAAAFDAASSSGESDAVESDADSFADQNSPSSDGEPASEAASEGSEEGDSALYSGSDSEASSGGDASDADQPANAGGIEQDEAAELKRQYAEAAAQDQIALTSIKDRTSKERTKGLAVLHQKQLWEQNLEMRILLQRCSQAANRIPYGLSHTLAVSADSALAQGYATLVSSASQTIDELLELHSALVDQHPAAQQIALDVTKASSSKRSREEEDGEAESVSKWQRIDEEYRKLTPFRDASIDRWHRKTMLISGAGALKGNLRALNQSVSSQVALLMKDPTKLARRTGVSSEQRPRVLCQAAEPPAEPAVQPTEGQQSAGAGMQDSNPSMPARSTTAEELDLEAFDDGEFYAQLLKEFLDSSSGAGNLSASGLYPQGKKKRKQVDRRASKGRKLRYHVQDKLVNFMAPVEQPGHEIAAQLFGSLFGGR